MSRILLSSLILFFSYASHAAISLSATRLIISHGEKEGSIKVFNDSSSSILIQSWLDAEDNTVPPFAISPPLAKLNAKKSQLLRVLYSGQKLPKDRESVFWLSVQEIPHKSDKLNSFQVAILQKIKLFYRPASLNDMSSNEAANTLTATIHNGALILKNPSPFHLNLTKIKHGGKFLKGNMISPMNQLIIDDTTPFMVGDEVIVTYVNDYGAVEHSSVKLSSEIANFTALIKREY